jgi:hypothetical protein
VPSPAQPQLLQGLTCAGEPFRDALQLLTGLCQLQQAFQVNDDFPLFAGGCAAALKLHWTDAAFGQGTRSRRQNEQDCWHGLVEYMVGAGCLLSFLSLPLCNQDLSQ